MEKKDRVATDADIRTYKEMELQSGGRVEGREAKEVARGRKG